MDYLVDMLAWVTCQHGLHADGLHISFGKVVGVIAWVT